MTTYIAKRLLLMIPTLFGVSLVVWAVTSGAPDAPESGKGPATAEQGKTKSDGAGTLSRAKRVFRAQYGLDKPAILNFYYDLDRAKVEKAVQNSLEPGGPESERISRQLDAREALIKWGYYKIPALVDMVSNSDGPLRGQAKAWLLKSAERVTRIDLSESSIDDEQDIENRVITAENRAIKALDWAPDSSEDEIETHVAGILRWYEGAQSSYAAGLSEEAVEQRLKADESAALDRTAVAALVSLARSDGRWSAVASRTIRRIVAAESPIDEAAVDGISWSDDTSANKRQAARTRLDDWWDGVQGRWDYSGWGRMRVLLLETRFAKYWGNLLQFDLGYSSKHKEKVLTLILTKLRYSLTLALGSLILAYLIAVPLGLFSAKTHGQPVERGLSVLVFVLYSLPSFFVATLVVKFLSEGQPGSWEWIPTDGFESQDAWKLTTWGRVKDTLWHVAAPMFCMTYGSLAALSRYAKTGLMNVIRSDYVRTARAKGLSEFWVTYKHAARPGIIPVITLLGGTLPIVVSGSIIVEFIFRIPGFGLLMVEAAKDNDYNVIVGVTLVTAVLVMIGILLSDILYAVADPRISLK